MSADRLQFLVTLNDRLRLLRDPVEIQGAAVRLLGEHLGVNRVSYAEIDGDEFIVIRAYDNGVQPLADRGPIPAFGAALLDAYRRGETVAVNDVASDTRFTDAERAGLSGSKIAALVGMMLLREGRWRAAFGVYSATPRMWTREQIALIEETGGRMWVAAERARAEDALRTSEERHAFLLKLSDALRPLSDPSDVQQTAARLLGEHLQVNRVGYAEIEGREYIIRCEYTRGVPSLVGRGLSGTFGVALRDAYRRGDTVVVNDVASDPRFTDPELVTMQGRQVAAFIGVTLIKGGQLVAAFGANNATPRLWTPLEITLVRDVAERTWEAAERARAEVALREREQRLRLALDASAGGSWTWDARTNHLDWDDVFRVRYGLGLEEPASFDAWLARVHEEDRPRLRGFLGEIRHTQTRDTWDHTFRLVRPDGAVSWIQSLGRVDRDATGRVTRLTGLDLDVTRRRLAEETLKARREEEHDRELRLLLETATQGIVSVDATGTIVTANRALATMFGWAPEELIGQSIERLLPSSLHDLYVQQRSEYFEAPHLRPARGGLDLVGQRKDGSTFPIEVSVNHAATPLAGRAIAFVTDITERQRADAALQERTVELEHRTAQLSRLASDLTLAEHHAREQLAKTLHDGLQQMLLVAALNLDQQVKLDTQRGTTVELIVQAKRQLDEAIAAARSLSFELFPPVLQRSGLPAALTWLADWTRTKYGLEVRVSADPLANSTRKDVRTLLFESVRELLFNAVKHAQADRVAVDLVLDPDDMLCITVTDEGIGFDQAQLVDRAKAGQVGWGLFSIRERLTLLGGRFDIDSAPGQGARFRLVAPRSGAQDVVGVEDPLSRLAIEGAPRVAASRALTILIVDDHATVRGAFRQVLQDRPELRVVGDASNGLEAIAQAHALRPDVILMDISMPDMDGVEATRRLRAELPSIQILGISMLPRTQDLHPIEEAGAAGFFVKGADTQRLIHHLLAIHAAIDRVAGEPAPGT